MEEEKITWELKVYVNDKEVSFDDLDDSTKEAIIDEIEETYDEDYDDKFLYQCM